jgi:phage terminase small subunit
VASLTQKQELFAQKYVELGSQTEAYKAAYKPKNQKPASINRTAKKCFDHVKIQARIKELQNAMAKDHGITMESLLAELEEARAMAKSLEKPDAMVKATMGKAKLLGMDKDPGSAASEAETLADALSKLADKLPG